MSVRSGAGCQFHFEILKSTIGLAGIVSSKITIRPKHGRLGKNTNRIYLYRADSNYVGSDEFELGIRYNRDDGRGDVDTLLQVKVSVY